MNRRSRLALAAATALGTGLLMTACQNDTASNDAESASVTATPTAGSGQDTGEGGSTGGSAETPGADDGESADKSGYGQGCGANDIDWSATSETQAGGYILIAATAKPGITCVLPAGLPTVSFGSDGTQAGPAEQSAGPEITLKSGVTAYAGVNPKTTSDNGGKELTSIIVSVGNEDPNPVSLEVGTITVDSPVVTNWHTSASEAVPFSN
ncbi:DUF4232 domain-containing protein [Streptomyces sp. S1A]|uniref:DUF4232 domain-containing protein n=1 Tax=Streptomyces sp. ICN903 TaxID=2964654 RepID=UPI001EDAF761|nr:DUF4232 domain-containing protein [Streptomyces sp. ICN903]MCG3039938.1 DUF4232 domain-containing protein [Streptomyces sp. ICN903]